MPLIRVDEETKALLDELKPAYGTYGNVIKNLSSQLPYVLSLTVSVPPQTWVERKDNSKPVPFTARVLSCNIFFPPGCEDLVQVRIGIGDSALSDWIRSGDNKQLTIPINKEVIRNTEIWAEIQNLDTANAHTPTIEFILAPIEVKAL